MTAADLDLSCCTVQQAIQRICERYQVDYVTLHVFRSGEDAENKPYVRTNYPDSWVRHYLLNDYVRIDPVLQMAEQVAGPFCWTTITPQGRQVDMMELAIQHGLGRTGFSVRHIDAIGRRSVLSFNAKNARSGDSWEPHLADMRNDLIQLAHHLHHKALAEIYLDGESLPHLSRREIECLRWIAEGKTHADIAIILNLSEHTVRGYLKDVRTKLNCVTLAQAVSNASSLGLI